MRARAHTHLRHHHYYCLHHYYYHHHYHHHLGELVEELKKIGIESTYNPGDEE